MNWLKFAKWTEEQWDWVLFSDESNFNLFSCDSSRFVRLVLRNDIHLSALKAASNFSVMVFGMIFAAGTGILVMLYGKTNATVYKEILKKHVPNLRIAINQPAVFMHCVIQRSLLRYFFLRRMLLLWSGLPKVHTWIQLRMSESNIMKELRKRIQGTSKNYGLIRKENGRKYPLMNARY